MLMMMRNGLMEWLGYQFQYLIQIKNYVFVYQFIDKVIITTNQFLSSKRSYDHSLLRFLIWRSKYRRPSQ